MPPCFPRSFPLRPFDPDQTGVVKALEVHLQELNPGTLILRYVLDADVSRLRIPPGRPSQHVDELWKHTCFEMFMRKEKDTPAYCELNASPSMEWALYSFDDYHKHMTSVNPAQPPKIHIMRGPNRLQLDVRLDLNSLALMGNMALAAVIEDDKGGFSYWALKHPASRPDFHHPDSFVLRSSSDRCTPSIPPCKCCPVNDLRRAG